MHVFVNLTQKDVRGSAPLAQLPLRERCFGVGPVIHGSQRDWRCVLVCSLAGRVNESAYVALRIKVLLQALQVEPIRAGRLSHKRRNLPRTSCKHQISCAARELEASVGKSLLSVATILTEWQQEQPMAREPWSDKTCSHKRRTASAATPQHKHESKTERMDGACQFNRTSETLLWIDVKKSV